MSRAVTYTVNVTLRCPPVSKRQSKLWATCALKLQCGCKVESLLLYTTNRKCYMAYRIAAIPMTLSDCQGHSPTASIFKCDISYSSWQHTDTVRVARFFYDSEASRNWLRYCNIILNFKQRKWDHWMWLLSGMQPHYVNCSGENTGFRLCELRQADHAPHCQHCMFYGCKLRGPRGMLICRTFSSTTGKDHTHTHTHTHIHSYWSLL